MYDSITVANRFLELAADRQDTLTPMQLLKLVYIAHGWHLGLLGTPLLRDDIEAWQYGPVVPRLYRAIKQFRSQPVVGPLAGSANEKLDANSDAIVQEVYDVYGRMSGPTLSRLTHAPGTPWAATYVPGGFGVDISNDLIEDHYQKLAAQNAEQDAQGASA